MAASSGGDTKPGAKTSEFYVSIAALLMAALSDMGILGGGAGGASDPDAFFDPGLSAAADGDPFPTLVYAVLAAAYTIARTWLKVRTNGGK